MFGAGVTPGCAPGTKGWEILYRLALEALVTTVRIAHAEPRPGDLGNGVFITRGFLVVLADDAGHRALPVWLREPAGGSLSELLEGAAAEIATAQAPEQLTARLLRAAGALVTGVDIEVTADHGSELDPDQTVARIGLGGPAGARHVTARLGLGLATAAAAGAPVRVPDDVMDRLAVPVRGDDLLGPFLDWVPPTGRAMGGRTVGWPFRLPVRRPRYEPRNMDFADGLDRWDLDGSFLLEVGESHRGDYAATTEDRSAALAAAVEQPVGSAALMQTIFADDYRGATVVFRGEIRTAPLTYEAGLRVEILRHRHQVRDDHGVTIAGGRGEWTGHEITAAIPEHAEFIRFGLTLTGPGRIILRRADLTRRA
jgi:hypothetical protein